LWKKKYHEQWAKEWPKIKGVFTEITSICEALKKAARQSKQDSMPISVMATNDDMSKKNLDQLDPSFMYTQILKEVLLSIEFEEKHIKEFINYCRDTYAEDELKNVKKFEQTYHDETPLWWYTYNCFLYSMLNRALWLMDVNMIIKLGFFINHLHLHIEKLHQEQFGNGNTGESFTVYLGQGMSKAAFKKMSEAKSGLISFNNFLSTSRDRNVSLKFTRNSAPYHFVLLTLRPIHFVSFVSSPYTSSPPLTLTFTLTELSVRGRNEWDKMNGTKCKRDEMNGHRFFIQQYWFGL
jgi:hypothetical protein